MTATPPSTSSYTRFGNDSSAPLPLLPRRHSAHPSPGHSRPASPTLPPALPTAITVQAPTPSPPPAYGAESRRASFDSATPTARVARHARARGGHVPRSFFVLPPERSTPMPGAPAAAAASPDVQDVTPRPRMRGAIPQELLMTPRPRPLSADFAQLPIAPAMARSISHLGVGSTAGSTSTLPLKLRNGKPLKSSLKSSLRTPHPPLTVVTAPDELPTGMSASKSAPATPYKAVHFDPKLEHVKLFLAEQKPLAVSRDGSPNYELDTTSAEEFPSFIYGKDKGVLVMQRLNFSDATPAATSGDVMLESVTLAADVPAVNGVVRARNLAFEKRIAIRFTFDDWQTTSEVTARYVSGCADAPDLDRFAFVIKLHDLLPGRERSLMFAIRYVVLGREIWDSRGGENYRLRFYHELPAAPQPARPEPKPVGEKQIEDLRSRLEAVVKRQASGSDDEGRLHPNETVGSLLAQHSRQRWQGSFSLSPSPVGTPNGEDHESSPPPLRFRSGSPLGSRYSFTDALRDAKALAPGTQPSHARTNTFPGVANTVAWPRRSSPPRNPALVLSMSPPVSAPVALPMGSPREAPDYSATRVLDDQGDVVTVQPFARRSLRRSHSRGGSYFDMQHATLTPPTTPLENLLFPPSLSMSPSPSPETSSTDLPDTPEQSGTDDESPDGVDCDLDADNVDTPATPRAGYARFALGAAPRTKSVSPTPTLRGRAQPPLLSPSFGWCMPQLQRVASDDSTMSESSTSEPSSSVASPLELTPRSSFSGSLTDDESDDSTPMDHLGNYATLLDKFCFFTGDGAEVPRADFGSGLDAPLGGSSPMLDTAYRRISPTASGAATPVAAA